MHQILENLLIYQKEFSKLIQNYTIYTHFLKIWTVLQFT